MRKVTSHILIEDIFDHLPTMLLLNNLTHKPINTNLFTYDTKNLNPEEFVIDLYNQYSNFFSNDWNLNQSFEQFVYILRDTFNKHALLTKKCKKEQKLFGSQKIYLKQAK